MEAPKCKLCDKRHFGLCRMTVAEVRQAIEPPQKPVQAQPTAKPSQAKFDRNAYQRDYMREWRRAKSLRDKAKPV